jgi:3-hydroxyacyl-CoA dehydrogenase
MTNAEHVAAIGAALYGEHWALPLARFAGVNVRTIQRCKVAAASGEENAQAAGVLNAIYEGLDPLLRRVIAAGFG